MVTNIHTPCRQCYCLGNIFIMSTLDVKCVMHFRYCNGHVKLHGFRILMPNEVRFENIRPHIRYMCNVFFLINILNRCILLIYSNYMYKCIPGKLVISH